MAEARAVRHQQFDRSWVVTDVVLTSEVRSDGWYVMAEARSRGLLRATKRNLPFEEWASIGIPRSVLGVAAMRDLLERGAARPDGQGGLFIPHDEAAKLGGAEAQGLGLAPAAPFQLDLKSKGTIGEEDFQVSWQFVRAGVREFAVELGSSVSSGGTTYRLPEPIYGIIQRIKELSTAKTRDDRLAKAARLREALPPQASALSRRRRVSFQCPNIPRQCVRARC